jgi:hypothetical protein
MRGISFAGGALQLMGAIILIAFALFIATWVGAIALLAYISWWIYHTSSAPIETSQESRVFADANIRRPSELGEPTAPDVNDRPVPLPPATSIIAGFVGLIACVLTLDGIPYDGALPGAAASILAFVALRNTHLRRVWSRRAMLLTIGLGLWIVVFEVVGAGRTS